MIGFIALLASLSLLAGVNSFAISSKGRSVSSLSMSFAGGLVGGAGPELKNFDPLKLSENSDWLLWFREAEIKHSRIAMLATVGWIVADFVQLPGEVHQVSSLAAHNAAVASGALPQILFWVSLIEHLTYPAAKGLGTTDRAPGDFSFDPLKLGAKPANLEKYKISELKNGRLAMLAFSGIVTQSALYDKGFPYF